MKKYTRFKADMVNCKEEYTDKEEYNMKKYVKSAVNVHNIKHVPDLMEFIDRYFTDMFGVNENTSSAGLWNYEHAAIKGNDVICTDIDSEIFTIFENAAKYVDELFDTNSWEELEAFVSTHSDVTIKETTNIFDIFD